MEGPGNTSRLKKKKKITTKNHNTKKPQKIQPQKQTLKKIITKRSHRAILIFGILKRFFLALMEAALENYSKCCNNAI